MVAEFGHDAIALDARHCVLRGKVHWHTANLVVEQVNRVLLPDIGILVEHRSQLCEKLDIDTRPGCHLCFHGGFLNSMKVECLELKADVGAPFFRPRQQPNAFAPGQDVYQV
jgi:hypothetical protein